MKKLKSFLPRLLIIALIAISISGIFEARTSTFLKKVAENNVEFLAVITEVKMVVSGLSSTDIPFISGHTEGIETSLDKVQNYLLITDAITFMQIMLIAITRSMIFKIILVGLFLFSLFEKKNKHITRILILALALSPGLSIYTVVMQEMSKSASIDFGDTYIQQVKKTVDSVQKENGQLMQEHEQNLTNISNGHKGLIPLRKFKENVSYDLKKASNSIKGDYKEIRTLIKSAGHELTAKVSRFCSMILFSLFLLPIGYVFLVKTLFHSMFNTITITNHLGGDSTDSSNNDSSAANANTAKSKKSFFSKLGNIWKAVKNEFIHIEEEIENSSIAKTVKQDVKKVEQGVKKVEQKVVPQKKKPGKTLSPASKATTVKSSSKPAEQKTTSTASKKPSTQSTSAASTSKQSTASGSQKPSNTKREIKRSPGSILSI